MACHQWLYSARGCGGVVVAQSLEERRQKERTARRAWRAANPEVSRARVKAYRTKYPERFKAQRQAYFKKYATELRRRKKLYAVKHRDRDREKRQAQTERYRARKRHAPINDFTVAQWQEMKAHYGNRCVYCGRKMVRLAQDHITPLSQGGAHTRSNIVPACQSCNSKKGKGAPLRPIQPLLL